MFCDIIYVLNVTYDQYNTSMMNKMFSFSKLILAMYWWSTVQVLAF